MKTLKELKENRSEIQTKVEALVNAAATSELTAEQKIDWANLQAQISTMDGDIIIAEQVEEESKNIAKRKLASGASGASALPGATQDNASEEKEILDMAK